MTTTTMPNDANPKEIEEWRSRGELRGNDNLARDSIFKQPKRTMAAELSRELGVKCLAGQVHVANLGFTAGGCLPCMGYRRLAISAEVATKRLLGPGERKPVITDRVRWVLRPPEDVSNPKRATRIRLALYNLGLLP